jgi:hypothetical protein
VKGTLDREYASFSPAHDPAVTAVLKKPALTFLTDVSCSSHTGLEVEEQWKTLVEHAPPNVIVASWELQGREVNGGYKIHNTEVEAPGMTFTYYEVWDSEV